MTRAPLSHVRHPHRIMHFYLRELLPTLIQPIFLFLTMMSAFLNVFGGLTFYFVENGKNPNLKSFLDALYFAVTTMTGVGYGDIVPTTDGGKVVGIGLMLLGTAIFASFTAALSAALLELELKRRSKSDES